MVRAEISLWRLYQASFFARSLPSARVRAIHAAAFARCSRVTILFGLSGFVPKR